MRTYRSGPFSPRRAHALAFLLFTLLAGAAHAQPKSSPGASPYQVQVVLHIAENRFLTPLFQEQLQKDLRDRLRIALGKVAVVNVTRTHGLLADIEADGLRAALNGWDEVSGTRTCFVLLEYAAGRYRLRLRQHDGLTGLASPNIQEVFVSDRGRIAETAATLIRRDFGLVGTVAASDGDEVVLEIHGGELIGDLADWIQPGQAFLPCRIGQEGARADSTRVPWTLLEVLPGGIEKGRVRCRLWRRFASEDLTPDGGVYRCLLLPPSKARLRVQLLEEKTFAPRIGLSVQVLRPGEKEASIRPATDLQGRIEVDKDIANFVILLIPSGKKAQVIPLPLLDDTTIVVTLRTDADAEDRASLEYRVGLWERRILEDLRLGNERLKEINEQILRSFNQALETARYADKSLTEELESIDQERGQIKKLAGKLKLSADLARGDAMLGELHERHKEMQVRLGRYTEAVKEATDIRSLGLKSLLEKAKLHEDLAEFEQAIQSYRTLLKISPGLGKVRAYLDRLEGDWKLAGPDHEKARRFVYDVWPKLDLLELAKHQKEAEAALRAFKEAGDRLSPQRFLKANVQHAANVVKKAEALKRDASTDARNQAKIVRETARALADLTKTADVLVSKKEKK